MAAPHRRTKKIRKRKERTCGAEARRKRRNQGSTPSLDRLLDGQVSV